MTSPGGHVVVYVDQVHEIPRFFDKETTPSLGHDDH